MGTERRAVIGKTPEFPAASGARQAPRSLLTNGPDASLLLRRILLRSLGPVNTLKTLPPGTCHFEPMGKPRKVLQWEITQGWHLGSQQRALAKSRKETIASMQRSDAGRPDSRLP